MPKHTSSIIFAIQKTIVFYLLLLIYIKYKLNSCIFYLWVYYKSYSKRIIHKYLQILA